MEKITLEKFREIKNQISDFIENVSNTVIESLEKGKIRVRTFMPLSQDEISTIVDTVNRLKQLGINNYNDFITYAMNLQNELLNYDLSDIPFNEWHSYTFISDKNHEVDFSNTKANIDFEIVNYYGNIKFKGCNVINLDMINIEFLNSKNFDDDTIKRNNSIFLTDIFSDEFREKYYNRSLTLSDFYGLSKEQVDELEKKQYQIHSILSDYDKYMIDILGIDKVASIYIYSHEEYEAISVLLYQLNKNPNIDSFNNLINNIKNSDVSNIKKICFEFAKDIMINSDIKLDYYPELFKLENKEIFLLDVDLPDEVKSRYFGKSLTLEDVLNYKDVFLNLPIESFITDNGIGIFAYFLKENYGVGSFQQLLTKYPDVLVNKEMDFWDLRHSFELGENLETDFKLALKNYFLDYCDPFEYKETIGVKVHFNGQEWLSPFYSKIIQKITTNDDLLNLNDQTIVIDNDQRRVFKLFNIANIKRFEQETGFFTHRNSEYSEDLEMFNMITTYFERSSNLYKIKLNFKNGHLSYQEFLEQFAKLLNEMKNNHVFTDYPNYDFIRGEFRDKHPEIFMDINAPQELKNAFYKDIITPKMIFDHKGYIKYLIDKNLSEIIKANIKINNKNFIDEYVKRYGNEKFLSLISKYGEILSDISIDSYNNEIENEEEIDELIREAIYILIVTKKINYRHLSSVDEFVQEYPDIFVDFSRAKTIPETEIYRLTEAYYVRNLTFDDIKKYPELVELLDDKSLRVPFSGKYSLSRNEIIYEKRYPLGNERKYSDLKLYSVLGNQKLLKLCSRYGKYMEGASEYYRKEIEKFRELPFEEIVVKLEKYILEQIMRGNIIYNKEDAPIFLKEKNPELFLSDDAPEDLKKYFYNFENNYPMSFKILHEHKEWLPYLEGKNLIASLLQNRGLRKNIPLYLNYFGEEKGIKLGINRAETVTHMIEQYSIGLMYEWYRVTGCKFIPDYVVMQNFDLDDASKFLTSASNWSSLMRIKNFADNADSRDAMLKVAYSFGAFDHDQRGFKKVIDLLTNLPRKIDEEYGYIIERIDASIDVSSQRRLYYHNESEVQKDGIHTLKVPNMSDEEKENAYNYMINYIKNHNFSGRQLNSDVLLNFLESLKHENVNIDFSKPIFEQLYRKDEDGSYTLILNNQNYPKSSQFIRNILNNYNELPIITPDKAHHYLGGFKLEYDPEFREFFLNNLDIILKNDKYLGSISQIQRRFNEIKIRYSNIHLTIDLAYSYINNNKYENVNVGNEEVAEVAAFSNYSQEDFETLQKIYNYGKQRVFSSIPRVQSNKILELSSGRYTYEILRLDSAKPMSEGIESDCCQTLHEPAEICMEHSMVSHHGRIFEIRDDVGRLIAQSWVWRNKGVLCFDNIEVPDKRMWDHGIPKGREDDGIRNQFTDDVLSIYQRAATELVEKDNETYKKLFEQGKITEEQYEGLKLSKVTVGRGYSNIKGSFEILEQDKGIIASPLPFDEPVKLSRGLYTSDSKIQYKLEDRGKNIDYEGETLAVHNDDYIEYSDSNFNERLLSTLNDLEVITKDNLGYLDTRVDYELDKSHLVSEIAKNYGLNPNTTRIIVNPNFAIIYDINGDYLTIGDLLYNTKIDNGKQQMDITNIVLMQMKLALDQISKDKKIDISELNLKQREMYKKITELTDELDIERGIGRAR